jgi:hypothetical protein
MNPDIIMHLNWAINTIRDKVMFGRDELGAALAREMRSKGVMLMPLNTSKNSMK